MEGPGGYQFVGRTLQMWNRYRQTGDFRDGKRWLLRFFDQLRFHPVSASELEQLRSDFPYGKTLLSIEPTVLRLRDYRRFLEQNAASIQAFKARQQAAFEAERERWGAAGSLDPASSGDEGVVADTGDGARSPTRGALVGALAGALALPADCIAVSAPVTGSVWQLKTRVGAQATAGEPLLILEAMKMEIAVPAEQAGTIVELRCARGQAVTAGETLVVLRPAGARP
jgi:urea carboxylase